MDFGTVIGLIALAVSVLSLLQGWRSDKTASQRMEEQNKENNRQADQIDLLIEQNRAVLEQSGSLIELVRDLALRGND